MITVRGAEASEAALREERTEKRRGERRQRDVVKYLNRRVGTRGGERARGGRTTRVGEVRGRVSIVYLAAFASNARPRRPTARRGVAVARHPRD